MSSEAPGRVNERPSIEGWRYVWRHGFQPLMNSAGLEALRKACEDGSDNLVHGSTCFPVPHRCNANQTVKAGCAVSLPGWLGWALSTVGEVEEYFARLCVLADRALGDTMAHRHFLNWFDDAPETARRELRLELTAELLRRKIRGEPATVFDPRPAPVHTN